MVRRVSPPESHFTNVRVAGTNVRIDLLIVDLDTDDDGKPVLQ